MLRELFVRAGLPATPVPHYVPSGIVNVNAFANGSRRLASIALMDGLPGWGNPEPSWLRTHTACRGSYRAPDGVDVSAIADPAVPNGVDFLPEVTH